MLMLMLTSIVKFMLFGAHKKLPLSGSRRQLSLHSHRGALKYSRAIVRHMTYELRPISGRATNNETFFWLFIVLRLHSAARHRINFQ
jgi:hypothetical protein